MEIPQSLKIQNSVNLIDKIEENEFIDNISVKKDNMIQNQIDRLNLENFENIRKDNERRKDREKDKENNLLKLKNNLPPTAVSSRGAITTSTTTSPGKSFSYLRHTNVTPESQNSQKSPSFSMANSLRASMFGGDQSIFNSTSALGDFVNYYSNILLF